MRFLRLFERCRFGSTRTRLVALIPFLLAAQGALGAQHGEALSNVGSVPREAAGARDLFWLDGETWLDRAILVLPRRDPAGLAVARATIVCDNDSVSIKEIS